MLSGITENAVHFCFSKVYILLGVDHQQAYFDGCKKEIFLRKRWGEIPHIISVRETLFPYRIWKYVALKMMLGEEW